MEPNLILVKPPQVFSLDPQKYLSVIFIVVLIAVNVNAPIFPVRPHTNILSLHFNQYYVIVLVESADAECAIVIAVSIDSV